MAKTEVRLDFPRRDSQPHGARAFASDAALRLPGTSEERAVRVLRDLRTAPGEDFQARGSEVWRRRVIFNAPRQKMATFPRLFRAADTLVELISVRTLVELREVRVDFARTMPLGGAR